MKDYSVINDHAIEFNDRIAKKQQDIRIIPEVKFVSSQGNCQGGNIDICRNSSWCAQCVDLARAQENPCKKIVVGEVLHIPNM